MHTTTVLTEIPEELNLRLKEYLERHPDWDKDRAMVAALSLFLLQDGNCPNQPEIGKIYLDAQFGPSRNN